MKKKLFIGFAGMIAVAAISLAIQKTNSSESSLLSANIEALTRTETDCIGSTFKVITTSSGWDCINNEGSSCCPLL